jgi:hypothetical protein
MNQLPHDGISVLHQLFHESFGRVEDGIFYADNGQLAVSCGKGAPAVAIIHKQPGLPWGRPPKGKLVRPSMDMAIAWGVDAQGTWYQLRWRPGMRVRARNIASRPFKLPPQTQAEKGRRARGFRTWGRFVRYEVEGAQRLAAAYQAWLASKCDLL